MFGANMKQNHAEENETIEALDAEVRRLQSTASHAAHAMVNLMTSARICSVVVYKNLMTGRIQNGTAILGRHNWWEKPISELIPELADYFKKVQYLQNEFPKVAQGAANTPWTLAFPPVSGYEKAFDDWVQLPKNSWTIKDGTVMAAGDMPKAMEYYLVSPNELVGPEEDFRIEYEACALANPVDLSVITGSAIPEGNVSMGDSRPERNGYCFAFGAFNNDTTELQRGMETFCENREVHIKPGQTHHCVAERIGGMVRFFVDGLEAYSVLDCLPLIGKGHGCVGLYTCGKNHSFTGLKVFVRPTCLTPNMIQTIESLRKQVIELHDAPSRFVEIRYSGGNTFLFKDVSDVVTYRDAYEAERIRRKNTEETLIRTTTPSA
jgi:hypothetical protein